MMVYKTGNRSIYYLAQPRTASRSTTTLMKSLGFQPIKSVGFHTFVPRLLKPDDIVITTVRNHHDWVASYYCMFGTGQPFNVWAHTVTRCKGPKTVPWVKRINQMWKVFWQFTPYSNVIWKFETLQEDFKNTLQQFFPKHDLSLPMIGRSRHVPQYTSNTFDYIATTFLEERQQYGYAV